MRIGVFGDSQVDPHHVKMCAEVNPLIDYDDAIAKVWYNRLAEEHDVDIHAQVSRDNLWIDSKWREHKHKYDLCIIRPAPGPRIRFSVPDEEWHVTHKKVFCNFGPAPSTFNFKDVDMDHPYIKAIHFWDKYLYVQEDYKRIYELLVQDWVRTENTLVLPMNTVSKIGGDSPLFEIEERPEKARRQWNVYMKQKYPNIDLNLIDHGVAMLPFHRNPNHIALENHELIYQLLKTYIDTGVLETPSKVKSNPTWDFPHPVMDMLEENLVENNRRAGNIK